LTGTRPSGRAGRSATSAEPSRVAALGQSCETPAPTPEQLRHYFTTRLIKTYKGDLLEVRQYTRHSSLEMLQIYNDSIKQQADLPRFYSAFEGVQL